MSDAVWEYLPIASIADKVAMGPFGSSIKVETFVESGVPVISGQHLKGNRLSNEGHNFVTEAHANRLCNSNVRAGDVIFTHAGNIGQVAYIPEDTPFDRYVISQRQFYVRPDRSRMIPAFLTYFFKTREGQHRLTANSSPVGVPSIAQPASYIKTVEVPVPPLEVQGAIVWILETLDDKIELNRRMSQTLEEIARALFKSWFVDFDPVHAKAAGRQPVGMDAETAALFPSEFEDSELGLIPKGWGVSTVGQEFRVTMGQSPPGSTYNETGEGIPFYQGRSDFGFRFPRVRVFCSKPTRTAMRGDTLLSVRAPVGSVNMASQTCAIGRGVAALRHKADHEGFTYRTMENLGDTLAAFDSEGTVFGAINRSSLEGLKIVRPDTEIVERFEDAVSYLDQRISLAMEESDCLTDSRETLLPALLSGKILPSEIAFEARELVPVSWRID